MPRHLQPKVGWEWGRPMADREPLYVRVNEAPKVFGVSVSMIYREAKAGRLVIYKRGSMSLLKVAEVSAWIEGKNPAAREGGSPK